MGRGLPVGPIRAVFYAAIIAAYLLASTVVPRQPVLASVSAKAPRTGNVQILSTHPSLKNRLKRAQPRTVKRHPLHKDTGALEKAKKKADDLAAAKTTTTGGTRTPTLSPRTAQFNGLSGNGLSDTNYSPSDSTGDIGPANYIEMVNSQIGVYDRSLLLLDATSLAAFGAVGPFLTNPEGSCVFDPQIAWDQTADRWLYSMLEQVTSTNSCANVDGDYLDFGWSTTSDPLGAWCGFAINNGSVLDDYDKLGHDNNFIIIGANAYGNFGDETDFLGAEIWAINKPAAGSTTCPASPPAHLFNSLTNSDGSPATTPVPADTTDSSALGYVVSAQDPGIATAASLSMWHLASNAGTPVLTQDPSVTVADYSVPPSIPQPSTVGSCSTSGNCLDSLDGRLTQTIAHYDPAAGSETVWTQHAVADITVGALSVERWYELQPGLTSPRQSGNVSDSTRYIFNGAVTPTGAGNAAVIFYNSGDSTPTGFVDYRAQRRNTATALNAMGGEVVIATGTASDADMTCGVHFGPPQNVLPCRWGDYSAARPDPINVNAVWGTGMLVSDTGGGAGTAGWTTQIARMTPGCLSASLSSPASVQAGDQATFTANATDCSNPQYEFWLRNTNGSWSLKQAFSPLNTWTWNTTGTAAQTYPVTVWVTDSGDAMSTWDTYAQSGVTLTKPQPCASGALAGVPGFPILVGSVLALQASVGANTCSTPVYQYWEQAPGQAWKIVRPYSTESVWTFDSNGSIPGTYRLSVWMEQAGGSASSYQTYAAVTVTLRGCASVTATPSPASPQIVGTAVAFTAHGFDCLNPQYQLWMQAPGGSWHIAKAYSSTALFNWSTAGLAAGTYHFSVWVKDAASGGASGSAAGRWDAYKAFTFVLTSTPCTSVSASTSTAGTVTTITASAACPNPLYQFWMLAAGSTTWVKVQAYGPGATYHFDSAGKAKGTYRFSIWARDASSIGISSNAAGRWDKYTSASITVT